MALNSRQKTANYQATIGTTAFGTGTKTVAIDNIFYDTRCNLSYGFRPGQTELITINDEDDEGNASSYQIESPKVNESGAQLKHDYIQCEDGHDEIYFYHIWDWSYDLNSALQKTINRTVRGIKETVNTSTSGGPSISITSYSLESTSLSWTLTLDKVIAGVTGIPSGKDITIYTGATDDNKIFFRYSANTITVIRIGDVVNGAVITKVLNYSESAESNINADTICYAEISGGNNFVVNQSYTASLSGASIVVVAGKGILTRSAAVGIYVERNHKEIELSPIFYKNEKDIDCVKETDSDSDSDYVKGTLILTDGSIPYKNKWFATNPKTDKATFISNIIWSEFKLLPERDQLKSWMSQNFSSDIQLMESILEDTRRLLGNNKIQDLVDTCFGPITSFTTRSSYSPYQHITKIQESTQNLNAFIDDCSYNSVVTQSTSSNDASVAKTVEQFKTDLTNRLSSGNTQSNVELPDALYKSIVSNPDSLMNRINAALTTVSETFSDPVLYSLPGNVAVADGENEGTVSLIKTAFRDVPPRFPKVENPPNNVTVDDSKFDIVSIANIISTQIYSVPRFNFSSIAAPDSTFVISVTTEDGYLDTVTATAGTIEITSEFGNITVPSIDIGPGGTGLNQGLVPHIIWSNVSSVQSIYDKDFRFRTDEFSNHTSGLGKYRGNPFKQQPVYARLTRNLSSDDTTINVKSTSGFLSSGYLIIPKYIKKLEVYGNGNIKTHYYYDGEEIIYYSGKTSTSFTGCIRARYGTTSNFITSLSPFTINTGSNSVITSYSEGSSISQFFNYKLEA